MQTINGIQVVIREATEHSGLASEIAYAWYQPAGVDGIVEVSTATREELLDALSRIQLSDSVLLKSRSNIRIHHYKLTDGSMTNAIVEPILFPLC